MKFVVGAVVFIFFFSCTSRVEHSSPTVSEVNEVAKEIKLPKNLMVEIETEFSRETKLVTPVYVFVPASVQFSESSLGVLKNPRMLFSYPKGGGSLDLKDVVTGQGSFYMSLPKLPDNNLELLHIYYISNSPQKKIDGEVFGLGCGKWIDLKKVAKKIQDPNYLKLNTSDLRYLYVLAGTYILVYRQTSQIFISQISITDSRFLNELCSGVE